VKLCNINRSGPVFLRHSVFAAVTMSNNMLHFASKSNTLPVMLLAKFLDFLALTHSLHLLHG